MSKANDREFVNEYSKQLRKTVGDAEWATFSIENAGAQLRAIALVKTIKVLYGGNS